MENTAVIESNGVKFYKDRALWVGTFLGGPLTAGYFIAQNYKALNDEENAKITWMITIFATIVIFTTVFSIPEDVEIPNQLIPITYTAIAYFLGKYLQGAKIQAELQNGASYYGWGRVIGISVGSLVITFVALLFFILIIS